MDFSRQEYWIGLLFPSPGNIPDPGIEPTSLEPPELAGGFFTTGATREAYLIISLDLLICLMCCSYSFVGFFFFLLPCSSIFLVFVQLGFLSIFTDVK